MYVNEQKGAYMKKIIGVVPASNELFMTNFVYKDKYNFINNYNQRIKESGAIPVRDIANRCLC